MINYELATVLLNIAEASKQKDSAKNKVIDYTRASRTIRDYTGEIENAYSSGVLKTLPGINDDVYRLLEEFFKTGRIREYEELKNIYSEELIRFIRICGLGKNRIFKIYEILGIKNLDELKECIANKDIYSKVLEGPGVEKDFITPTHIDRLVASVDYFESTKGLYPKGYTDFFMTGVISEIVGYKDVKSALISGSLRRKKSFIGDIDLIILPEFNEKSYDIPRSEKLLRKMQDLSFVKRCERTIIENNNISSLFTTTHGIDIEIIISSDTCLALDLFYTTGSASHVKQIESIAKAKGWFKDGKIVISDKKHPHQDNMAGNRSEDINRLDDHDRTVYEALDMQFIPPELREGNDEIDQARNHMLPELIRQSDLKGDLHVHSYWSDGMMGIDEMVEKAGEFNYEYIAVTDHSASNVYGNGLDEKRMLEKIESVHKLRDHVFDTELLIGGEVDIKAVDRLDYDEDVLSKMDIVLASMHSNYLNTKEVNTAKVLSALENKYVDGIAHPTGSVFGMRAPYTLELDKIFEAAVKNNKALEINSYLLRLDLNDNLARRHKRMGGKFFINTDSHRIENLDMINLGIEIARRAGLEKEDVLNTMSLEELVRWKKER